ncbi:MAG: hypothetical protein ACRDVK_01545, partial [Acidimicrobiia bacterium]
PPEGGSTAGGGEGGSVSPPEGGVPPEAGRGIRGAANGARLAPLKGKAVPYHRQRASTQEVRAW